MVTASQQKLIDEIGKLLGEEGRVEAACLAGSLGRGQGDIFSDVDLLVLVEDGTLTEVSSALAARFSTVVRAVHVNKLFGGRVLNVVTADWQRFDLSFIQREDLARHNGVLLRSLFNRSGQTPPEEPEMPYRPAPEQLLKLVQEFIRVLGSWEAGRSTAPKFSAGCRTTRATRIVAAARGPAGKRNQGSSRVDGAFPSRSTPTCCGDRDGLAK